MEKLTNEKVSLQLNISGSGWGGARVRLKERTRTHCITARHTLLSSSCFSAKRGEMAQSENPVHLHRLIIGHCMNVWKGHINAVLSSFVFLLLVHQKCKMERFKDFLFKNHWITPSSHQIVH